MNIGVVGYGVVGKAVAHGFREKGHTVYINDTEENAENKSKRFLMLNCGLIFVCVPTPAKTDGGIDLTYVEQAVEELTSSAFTYVFKEERTQAILAVKPVIVIKSTVIPGTTKWFAEKYDLFQFACNPEFLRAEHAVTDFLNPDRIVIGASTGEAFYWLLEAYKGWDCPKIVVNPTTAETIKYIANALLTLKVAYACEVAEICQRLGVDAKRVMKAVCLDGRVNPSHLDPTKGPIPLDSQCLPKDLSALIRLLEGLGYESGLLKAVQKTAIK